MLDGDNDAEDTSAKPTSDRGGFIPSSDDLSKLVHSAVADYQARFASGDFVQSAIASFLERARSGDFGDLTAPNVRHLIDIADLKSKLSEARSLNTKSAHEKPSSYSPAMRGPASYFAHTEGHIDSLSSLHAAISEVTERNPSLRFVWRGVRDADWGLHSGLFRKLMEHNNVRPPADHPTGPQPFPTEAQMVEAERTMLKIARSEWRIDDTSPLEVFARLQHYGAPTRLIDISKNPYIGAWFATEALEESDHVDGRLFAIATRSVPSDTSGAEEEVDTTTRQITDDGRPAWHTRQSLEERTNSQWGTGTQRRIWVPPAYDSRIVAQNAGFVLDGVPITDKSIAPYFKVNASSLYWTRADILASGSIYAKMNNPKVAARSNSPGLAPTFSWRITAKGKAEIRRALARVFGYTRATIYPDVAALGDYLRTDFSEFAPPLEPRSG